MAGSRPRNNFTHLKAHDEQLVRLGLLAERYFAEDPNSCLLAREAGRSAPAPVKHRRLDQLVASTVHAVK